MKFCLCERKELTCNFLGKKLQNDIMLSKSCQQNCSLLFNRILENFNFSERVNKHFSLIKMSLTCFLYFIFTLWWKLVWCGNSYLFAILLENFSLGLIWPLINILIINLAQKYWSNLRFSGLVLDIKMTTSFLVFWVKCYLGTIDKLCLIFFILTFFRLFLFHFLFY